MLITQLLERNATQYPEDIALVEINPSVMEKAKVTWKEYSLIETNPMEAGRTEITWKEFSLPDHFLNLHSADFFSFQIGFHHLFITDGHLLLPVFTGLIRGKIHTICIQFFF